MSRYSIGVELLGFGIIGDCRTDSNLSLFMPKTILVLPNSIMSFILGLTVNIIINTGTPPLTRFFGPGKNRVKGKPRYRRSILVLKPQNGEFESSKSTFSHKCNDCNCSFTRLTLVKNWEKLDFEL